MASTYSPLLRIQLITTGEQSGTWGTTTNTNLGTLIEDAIAGTAAIDVTSGNITLTSVDGLYDQSRCAAIRVSGTPGVSRNIIAPAASHIYVVANGSDAAVVLKTSTSTGLTIPTGQIYLAYYDPTVGVADFKMVGQAIASTNTANTLVLRDASGNFSAGMITANLTGNVTGNASTVTTNANLTGAVTSVGNATSLGSFTSANLAAALTDETGTGANVFATSPTLVTPLLGTPTSGTLTNCTGLPVGSGVSGLGTGVATFLATPSSANLAAALTDETGTGANVFATSPTLVTPLLGTPTSGTLTNCTGLPISSGVSGLGTNVSTFLATPTSANLAAALTDETGTGSAVFSVSPALTGTPTVPTALTGTSTTQIASTAFVVNQIGAISAGVTSFSAGTTGFTPSTATTGVVTLAGNLAVANGGTGAVAITGTGNNVLSTTPTLVTPILGTPTSGTLTNCTGLPIASGVSGLAVGAATFLATPSSTNLAALLTDETGSGANVFATSPTLVTPILGTPASGNLTNCTALPISSGVSGLGTGVATFLATPSSANLAAALTDETGTGSAVFATSPTLVTPALGTPTSGTLTNCIGLPVNTGVSGLGTGVATFLTTPTSANLAAALTDETGTGSAVFATSPTLVTPNLGTPSTLVGTNITGTAASLTAGNATTATTATTATNIASGGAGQVPYNTGSGATSFVAAGTTGQVLRSTGTSAPAWGSAITVETSFSLIGAQALTYTAIPSWVRKITILIADANTSGTSPIIFQIGVTTLTTSGYKNSKTNQTSTGTAGSYNASATGAEISQGSASSNITGSVTFTRALGDVWTWSGVFGGSVTNFMMTTCGNVTVVGNVNIVGVTFVNGTDQFDSGTINVYYE
jgi:hypothetical protein